MTSILDFMVLTMIMLAIHPSTNFIAVIAVQEKENRVIFQTFFPMELTGGNVQCYGKCMLDIEDPSGKIETFQSIRCLGQRIILTCKDSGKVIRIDSALVGRHTTDTDYCIKKTLVCSRNVTNYFRVRCDGRQNCDHSFSSKYTNDGCGTVKYLALDIAYRCVMERTDGYSPTPVLVLKTVELQTLKSRPFPTPSTPVADVVVAKGSNFFWLLTVYQWMAEQDFIFKNRAHLALAIIISVFVGLVISIFFILDHSRRVKARKKKALLLKKSERVANTNRDYDDDDRNLEMQDDDEDDLTTDDGDRIPMLEISSSRYSNKRASNGIGSSPAVPLFVDIPSNSSSVPIFVNIPPNYQTTGEEDDTEHEKGYGGIFGDFGKDDDAMTENEEDDMTVENHLLLSNHNDYKKTRHATRQQNVQDGSGDVFYDDNNNDHLHPFSSNDDRREEGEDLLELMDRSSSRLGNLSPPPQELLSDHQNDTVPLASKSTESSPRQVRLVPPPLDFTKEEKEIPALVVTSPTTIIPSDRKTKSQQVTVVESVKRTNTRPCLKNRNSNSNNKNNQVTNNKATLEKIKKSVRYPSTIEVAEDFPYNVSTRKKTKRSKSICSEQSPDSGKRLASLMNFRDRDLAYASHQMDMLMITRSHSIDFLSSSNNNYKRSNSGRRCKQIRNESPLFHTASPSLNGRQQVSNKLNPPSTSQHHHSPLPQSNRVPKKRKVYAIGNTNTNTKNNASKNQECHAFNNKKNNKARFTTAYEKPIGPIVQQTVEHSRKMGAHNTVLVNEQSEHEHPISIEESGYQSRESDSFASSNRSTDDDCHVFSPNSALQGILKTSKNHHHHNYSKHETCGGRNPKHVEHTLSAGGTLPPTHNNNNNNGKLLTKVARRIRYENTRAKQQTGGIRPSESSMEDTSSRDSIQIPRNRIKSVRHREESAIITSSAASASSVIGRNCARLTSPSVYYSDPDASLKKVKIMTRKYNDTICTE